MILGVPSARLAFTHPFQNPVEEKEEEEEEAVYLEARIWEAASEGRSGRIVFYAAEERQNLCRVLLDINRYKTQCSVENASSKVSPIYIGYNTLSSFNLPLSKPSKVSRMRAKERSVTICVLTLFLSQTCVLLHASMCVCFSFFQ